MPVSAPVGLCRRNLGAMNESTATAELERELIALRRGYGIYDTQAYRIGSMLRQLAAVAPDAPTREVRRAVSRHLRATITNLSERDALIAHSVFAFDPSAGPSLHERIARVAHDLNVSERTVRRRVAEVTRQLAELMVADAADRAGSDAQPGWHVSVLSSLLRLDLATPEVIEQRRIVAAGDGLRRVELRASTPRHAQSGDGPRKLLIDVLQGARLIEADQQSESHHRYLLELPFPLAAGQEHEFTVSFRVPAGQPMRPYYVLTPLWRCERFNLRVRFDRDSLPERVVVIDRVPHRILDDAPPFGRELQIDSVGEVAVTFERPDLGYAYGIGWPEFGTSLRKT